MKKLRTILLATVIAAGLWGPSTSAFAGAGWGRTTPEPLSRQAIATSVYDITWLQVIIQPLLTLLSI